MVLGMFIAVRHLQPTVALESFEKLPSFISSSEIRASPPVASLNRFGHEGANNVYIHLMRVKVAHIVLIRIKTQSFIFPFEHFMKKFSQRVCARS